MKHHIDYRKLPIDNTLKVYTDEHWNVKDFNYVIVSLYADDYFYYNHELKTGVNNIQHATILYTEFDAYQMLNVAKQNIKDDNIVVKKLYPYAKIASLRLYLYSKYARYFINDGWSINRYSAGNNIIYDFGSYHACLAISVTNSKHTLQDAIDKAEKHGIIMDDEHEIIIGMDWQKFNDNMYLWQVQELGLI